MERAVMKALVSKVAWQNLSPKGEGVEMTKFWRVPKKCLLKDGGP